MSNFTWATEPPVVIYDLSNWLKARSCVRGLRNDIEHWRGGESGHVHSNGTQPIPLGREAPPDLKLVSNALQMCDMIHNAVHLKTFAKTEVFFAYQFCGRTIAAMVIAPRQLTYVNDIVTHPGAEGAGPILMECAINYVVSKGFPPALQLWALNMDSVGPYKGMGFVPQDSEQDLLLDLTIANSKWERVDEKWRYTSTRNPGVLYASKSGWTD